MLPSDDLLPRLFEFGDGVDFFGVLVAELCAGEVDDGLTDEYDDMTEEGFVLCGVRRGVGAVTLSGFGVGDEVLPVWVSVFGEVGEEASAFDDLTGDAFICEEVCEVFGYAIAPSFDAVAAPALDGV